MLETDSSDTNNITIDKQTVLQRQSLLVYPAKILIVVIFFGVLLSFITFDTSREDIDNYVFIKTHLNRDAPSWLAEYGSRQQAYSDWLFRRGTRLEQRIYFSLSSRYFVWVSSVRNEMFDLSFFERAYISGMFALLRISFVILACFRLWFLAVILGLVAASYRYLPYKAKNLLGQSGDDGLFCAGIQLEFGDTDSFGRPIVQLVGLSLPEAVNLRDAKKSSLVKVLESYSALNATNLHLAAIIIKHQDMPAYLAAGEEEQSLLSQVFVGASLLDNTSNLLATVLRLHAEYHNSEDSLTQLAPEPEDAPRLNITSSMRTLDSRAYAKMLRPMLHRVLRVEQRIELSQLPSSQIATLVLAYEASKTLSYVKDSGSWRKKSNYMHLKARAILNSLCEFSEDYSVEERQDLRRALIYSARSSFKTMSTVPGEFSKSARSMRQWGELLLAYPHQLQASVDAAELYGLIEDCHATWSQAFFDGIMVHSDDYVAGVYASNQDFIFVPFAKLVRIMRNVVGPEVIRRLDTLSVLVYQKQKLAGLPIEIQDEKGEKLRNQRPNNILTPFSANEIRQLSARHGVSLDDLRDWSSLRLILDAFGWLVTMVEADYVPEAALVDLVVWLKDGKGEPSELKTKGEKAMVPLRSTRLFARWGEHWSTSFLEAEAVELAQSAEHYGELLRG